VTNVRNHTQIVKLEMYIFCPISLVCASWICWCWLSQRRLRKFPAHLSFFPSSAVLGASVVWIISSIVGHEKIWSVSVSNLTDVVLISYLRCEDKFTLAQTNLMCGTQGNHHSKPSWCLLLTLLYQRSFYKLCS